MLGKSNVIDGRGVHGKAYRSFNKVLLASVYTESLLSHDLSHSTGSYVATAALVARNPREAPRQAEYEIEEDEERVVLGTVKVMESTLDGEWNKAICKPNSQHNAFAFAKQKQLANGEKRSDLEYLRGDTKKHSLAVAIRN
ncbi:hypothetical protein N7478_002342 [Penicillium angulare]|uniref:uncharacterized protein n=1 Tax=Penicillium angulare TaxID=116970 RepID=UPI0025423E85|nr:uncharacterized protein N7478_002342 [Penicillium angulare]KAJ5286656.1 hypothetical protein N7478_002342 [Penicillium angulare]